MPSPADSKSNPIKNDTTCQGSGKHLNGTTGVPRERYRHGKHNYAKPEQSATMESWLKEPPPFGVSVAQESHDAIKVSDIEKELEATLGAPPTWVQRRQVGGSKAFTVRSTALSLPPHLYIITQFAHVYTKLRPSRPF